MSEKRAVAETRSESTSPPSVLSDLIALIDEGYERLSPQFQQIAHYVRSNPDEVALAPVRVLAAHIGVHPSTVVRFAKTLNYRGFKEMQQIFKFAVYSQSGGENSRILALRQQMPKQTDSVAWKYASGTVASEINALSVLVEELDYQQVEQCVALINHARTVWIFAEADSRIATTHLQTMLMQIGLDVRVLSYLLPQGVRQVAFVKAEDVVLTFEFGEHSSELDRVLQRVSETGAKIVPVVTEGISRRQGLLSFQLPVADNDMSTALCVPLLFSHIIASLVAQKRDPSHYKPHYYEDFDPRGW